VSLTKKEIVELYRLKTITEREVSWLEKLIDDLEEALALPPGFVAFGNEKCSAQMDVSRFHRPVPENSPESTEHIQEMGPMHK
jgi:cob(I)alamin adenosyltransferase